jgi:choline dehydrogenase-like flavoprotein
MTSNTIPTEAEYVIIGGGTEGLVLAARLSEDPSKTIVVLEGGKSHLEDPRVNIPAMWTTLLGSEADWQFVTVPQVCMPARKPLLQRST